MDDITLFLGPRGAFAASGLIQQHSEKIFVARRGGHWLSRTEPNCIITVQFDSVRNIKTKRFKNSKLFVWFKTELNDSRKFKIKIKKMVQKLCFVIFIY